MEAQNLSSCDNMSYNKMLGPLRALDEFVYFSSAVSEPPVKLKTVCHLTFAVLLSNLMIQDEANVCKFPYHTWS